MCVYLHFPFNSISPFLSAIPRCSQCHPCVRGLGAAIIPISELGPPALSGDPHRTPGIQLLKFPFLYKITTLPLPTSCECSADGGKYLCGKEQEIFGQAEWVFLWL